MLTDPLIDSMNSGVKAVRIGKAKQKPLQLPVSQVSPKKQNQMDVYVCRKGMSYFKELAHGIVESDKSTICSIGRQPGNSEKS